MVASPYPRGRRWVGSSGVKVVLQGEAAPPPAAVRQDVLALGDEHERASYLAGVKGKPLLQQTVATCLDSIQRDKEGDKEVRGERRRRGERAASPPCLPACLRSSRRSSWARRRGSCTCSTQRGPP